MRNRDAAAGHVTRIKLQVHTYVVTQPFRPQLKHFKTFVIYLWNLL
jgi:hypothetical protein